MRKNENVYAEMGRLGITQKKLGEILGKDSPTISRLLNEVEWSEHEQDEVIKKIREYAARKNA